MKRKKRGSALIVTIIIFMFITTVSLAMLSMVSTNYYGRASESKRTQNLYGSESGLDTEYNIIAKTVETANVYGNAKVEELKTAKDMTFVEFNAPHLDEDKKALYALYADIDYWKYYNGVFVDKPPKSQAEIDGKIKLDNEAIDILIDKVFKQNFKVFIEGNLKKSIENNSYIKIVKNSEGTLEQNEQVIDNVGEFKIQSIDDNMLKPTHPENETESNVSRTLKIESGYDDEGKIIYGDYSLDVSFYNQENYELSLTSEFETNLNENNSAKVGKSLRTIRANYSLRVPNYSEVAFKESTANLTSDVKDIVGLTVGGDMTVDGNKLNITGDIFVQGNESGTMTSSNRTFEKYSGGIILDNPSGIQRTINFNDNVFTRGTFNIKNNVNTNIEGNLYAKNIYAGNGNSLSDNSKLTISNLKQSNEAVIDNDLSVKATNTAITINDFYGINDKTSTDENSKTRQSSSIIINDYKAENKSPSSVTIQNNAYIMGVAHLNTENGYQTGESVAVKGNYKAYSVPDDSGTEVFKYDNPLQVLDEDNVSKKATHFWNYWKNTISGTNSIDCGGVNLNPDKTYSIGAIVYSDSEKVRDHSDYNKQNVSDIVNLKRKAYAKNIYTISKEYRDNADLGDLYTKIGDGAETVRGLLHNMNILEDEDYKFKSGTPIVNKGQKMAIFAPQENPVVIKGTGSSGSYGSSYIVIDATTNSNVNAVIVAAGDVIIDGNVNFRGDIIAQGNLKVLGNSTVNIYYDKYITEDIQMSNGVIFNKVFGNGFGGQVLDNGDLDIKSNASDFLKTGLWKIIQ